MELEEGRRGGRGGEREKKGGGGDTFSVDGDIWGHIIGGCDDFPAALDARRRVRTLEKVARRFW